MDKKVNNYFANYLIEINEYIDNFEEKYHKMQKELFGYRMEKEGNVYVLDYESLFYLKDKINRKIRDLSNDMRCLLAKEMKN